MLPIQLYPTRCAICGTAENSTQLYPANFSADDFTPAVFSARRLPDRIHYQMVRCNTCGLVRSDPVADSGLVAQLYHQSTFDYEGEVDNIIRTYGGYLERLNRYGAGKQSFLEIGCGNGFFLEQARSLGYRDVRGVEPSRAAIDSAPPEVGQGIVCDIMRPGIFPEASFDAICLFQVLDHIFDPVSLLETCLQILRPGGLLLCLNHNVEAVSARILGERSPIIDIEHTYLYSPPTIARLLEKIGFQTKETGSARNYYSLNYVMRLVPLPSPLKKAVLAVFDSTPLGRLPLRVPLGNLYIIAQRPSASP
jgi:SAM-dependent methyltransferase